MAVRLALPRTLHMRIMVAIAVLQLAVVGLFSLYMMVQLVGNEVAKRQVMGHKIMALTAPAVESMVAARDLTALSAYLTRMAGDAALSGITVKDAQGRVLFSQVKQLSPPHPLARWLKESTLGARLSTELRDGNKYLGLMTVDLSNHELNQNIEIFFHNILYLFLILLAVDLIASELLIKYFVAPLGPLTVMAMDVSQGNWGGIAQPSERASDEVRHLTNAFIESGNLMRKQIQELEQTRAQLAQNELRLRNLVDNMQEVLLEVDKNGHVLFLNPVWEALTGYAVASSIGKAFSSFLIQPHQQAYFFPDRLEHITLYDLQLELRAHNGESVWVQMNTTLQYNPTGEFRGFISTLVDITENLRLQHLQRAHEQDLYKLTITDPLTGVYNRRHFDELLSNLLQINLNKGRHVALILLDVDGFKFINDTYGHPVGDEALKAVASALAGEADVSGGVARLAGDEFGIIFQGVDEKEADAIAHRIHDRIRAISIKLAVGQLQIQTSMGVAVAPGHGRSPQDLVRAADVALYHAKKRGRNRVDTLSRDVGAAIMDIFSQGFELRNALSAGMIAPFIQPIVDLGAGDIYAYEVLTRLRRGEQYIVADQFVLVAEDLGLIRDMDLFIIQQALDTVPPGVHLFLNVSLNSFYVPEFSQQLRALLLSPAAQERPITIEFTERQTTDLSEDFKRYFAELRDAGCRIALDDFGVGYSTYGYLRQLRPDFIKIDGSFVQHILRNPQDAKIVEQIRELSEVFGAQTIAEHVENEETRRLLQRMGVKFGQGYHFGRPVGIDDYFPGKEAVKL